MNRVLPIIAGFILGAAGGAFLGPGLLRTLAGKSGPASPAISTGTAATNSSGDTEDVQDGAALPSAFGDKLQEAMYGSSERKRLIANITIGEGLTPAQLRAAVAKVQAMKGSAQERAQVIYQLLIQWASIDPKGAAEYTQTIPDRIDRLNDTMAVVEGRVESDPKGAETWAFSFKDPETKREAINTLVQTIADADPRHALEIAEK